MLAAQPAAPTSNGTAAVGPYSRTSRVIAWASRIETSSVRRYTASATSATRSSTMSLFMQGTLGAGRHPAVVHARRRWRPLLLSGVARATARQRPSASRGQAIRGRSRTRDSFSALQFRQLIVKPCPHISNLVLDADGPLRPQYQSGDDLFGHMT